MKVSVVYAKPERHSLLTLDVPEGSSVRDVIERSGILKQFPEIDIETQRVGVYGKFTALDAAVEEGARVEIYRPITVDPATVRRRGQVKED
ncbi:MAG TPA: RnfH family protein [Azospirillum sp.]|nr:RnfH family protein [Azospirillum sp.]